MQQIVVFPSLFLCCKEDNRISQIKDKKKPLVGITRAVIRFDACFDRSEVNAPFHTVVLQFLLKRLSQLQFDRVCLSR